MTLFARNLCSYKNGSIVTKRCSPWGVFGSLCGDKFLVKRKFFDVDGEVESILLKNTGSSSQFFLVKPDFFEGWTDDEALKAYYNYKL